MSTPYNGGNDPRDPNDPLDPSQPNHSGESARDYEPYPEHPLGSHPENEAPGETGTAGYDAYPGETGTAGTAGYDAYPGAGAADTYDAYPGAGTADTYDAFDVNSAAAVAGASALRFHGQQLTDNIPGDGQSPHPINDPESNGWFHTKGTGKLKVFEALGWAFKAVFGNAKVWLLLGLVYLVLSGGAQLLPGIGSMVGSVGMFIFAPWAAGVALQETLVKNLTFNDAKAPAYGKTLGMYALVGLVTSLLLLIVFGIFTAGALSSMDLASLPQSPEELTQMSPEELFELFAPVLGAMGITGLLGLLLSPFVAMQVWYAADNNGTFSEALSAGFRAGASNYLPLVGLTVMSVLIALAGALLFGVGLVVALPVITLTMAHAYRQISAGPVPRDASV